MDDSKVARAKGEFKKTLDVTAGRTKRQLHTTRLRKTARQDRLAKKRSENVKLTDEGLDDAVCSHQFSPPHFQGKGFYSTSLEIFLAFLTGFFSKIRKQECRFPWRL
jgi:hypothetical protein